MGLGKCIKRILGRHISDSMNNGDSKGLAIEVKGLRKAYGRTQVLRGLDLEVPWGQVLTVLGPNGSGKTTTIRLLLDFIRPTKGRAEIFGMDARANSMEIRRRVGYLPGELATYENLTG